MDCCSKDVVIKKEPVDCSSEDNVESSNVFIKSEALGRNEENSDYIEPLTDYLKKYDRAEPKPELVVKTEHSNISCREYIDIDPLEVCATYDSEDEKDDSSQLESEIEKAIPVAPTFVKIEIKPVDQNGITSQDQMGHLGKRKSKNCLKVYQCSECDKVFRQKFNLNRHLLTHTGDKPFSCDVCEKSFSQKRVLDTHKLIHKGDKPNMCEICNTTFRHRNALMRHKLIHSGDKPYECDQCELRFRNRNALVIHKRVHSGEKPYNCHVCYKSFIQKSGLNKHKRIHLQRLV